MSMGMVVSLAIGAFGAAAVVFTSFERPPVDATQRGYRGTGMVEIDNPRTTAINVARNRMPESLPAQEPTGQPSSAVYTNVQVLKDVDAGEFLRLMTAITEWVSPVQGCNYCHKEDDLADDSLYTKIVSRRMLQMTAAINETWKPHVGETGVTCYTCHRGQPVPADIWFSEPYHPKGSVGNRAGQNAPSPAVGLTSLPNEPFTSLLRQPGEIRVVSQTALPAGNRQSIKQTEGTYGLMVHLSEALGVNCTFCHNSRSFAAWDQSSPQRATAWHGIRMVRDLNTAYLEPLKSVFPNYRLGPHGDVPQVNCSTCHQGANKPLYGARQLADYPELVGKPVPPASPSRQ